MRMATFILTTRLGRLRQKQPGMTVPKGRKVNVAEFYRIAIARESPPRHRAPRTQGGYAAREGGAIKRPRDLTPGPSCALNV